MKSFNCINCGATDMVIKENYMECKYCNSRFAIKSSHFPQNSIGMSLNSDITTLLQKCKNDPKNARKYANLILDIDPSNRDALKYL